MRLSKIAIFFLAALVLAASSVQANTEIFVTPSGKDIAAGTQEAPVATLPRAVGLARNALRTRPGEPVTIWLGDGTYVLSEGLVLGAADSGRPDAPVIYRAVPGSNPVIRIGRYLPAGAMPHLTDPAQLARVDTAARPAIREIDLKVVGAAAIGRMSDTFRGQGGLPELFQSGQPLALARWPNGEHGYAKIAEVLKGGGKHDERDVGGTFRYTDNRPERWLKAAAEGNLWLAGFWRVPWICEAIRVGALNPSAHTITFSRSVPQGIGSKYSPQALPDGTRRGDGSEKWYAMNLLEEIDQPGEWCVDFKNQRIYLWPAADPEKEPVFLADIRQPLFLLQNVQHVRLIGLTLDGGADDGIRIEGGSDVTIGGCTIRNFSRRGIAIVDGLNHAVLGCDLAQMGLNAIALRGGDRQTLTPCGHKVINNEIHHAGRLEPTAAVILGQGESLIGGGVGVNCVGVLFAHNRIHDCPNAGVYYSGNDNIIEFNEVFRIGLNSGDLGGFYSSGGWTSRGNIVRNNLVHHCPSANAYYVDDGDSGDAFAGNIAYRTMRGVLVGGGHDNFFAGNVFFECAKGSIMVDARGLSRNYTMQDPRLGGDFRSVPYDRSPWKEHYPKLARLLEIDPRLPSDIVITGNVLVASPLTLPAKPAERAGITVGPNLETKENPGFVAPEKLDFRLRPDANLVATLPGFTSIPVELIGLQIDPYRPVLPASSLSLLREPDTSASFDSAVDIEASNRKTP